MPRPAPEDNELAIYRNLLEPAKEFKDGFGWKSVIGILFCGLVMLPGSIYLGLMIGGNFGAVASWVTVILFSEVTRRALKTMSRQELVVLLHAANVMIAGNVLMPGGPFGEMVFRAFLVSSDAVRDTGMRAYFPAWYVPSPESAAIVERSFFHREWLLPIGLGAFLFVTGYVSRYALGYFFFRLTSDVEQLPFPLAPIAAQGAMALAEELEKKTDDTATQEEKVDAKAFAQVGQKKSGTKWRLFALGATIGIVFGFVQVGIPAITGLVLDKPVFLLPQPWLDTSPLTEAILPATPTGATLDLGVILIGMILPFWAVVGTFAAIVATFILNPILHKVGVLSQWQPGMNTINTLFANQVDFYMSFSIGMGIGIALVSLYATVRDMRRKMRALRERKIQADERTNLWATPKIGRGDVPVWMALAAYVVMAAATVTVCWMLLPQQLSVFTFLIIFVVFYNPLISYVNARLLGIAGQQVDIPFVKESAFILSGAKGINIWLAPIPVENYGGQAQSFRVNELTGVKFYSLMKVDAVAVPVLYILSFLFWAFIWHSQPIPSAAFPYAQQQWELQAKQTALRLSSTFVATGEDPAKKDIRDSQFYKALHKEYIGAGVAFTVIGYAVLSVFGLPILLIYGMIRGFNGIPHLMLLEIVGALAGRYYFQKRYGAENFLRMIPTVMAGYFTGVGLISMATIAMNLIKQAVSGAPF